ncbi:HamA C-terminal domain-containing protein [Undibacterium squillarum]|uniref:Anti-bacteriophage protein A/HamA C-terminal domain-containing protein n=1 Tax=Undibacterium squillarum TaxID=1131567 RepID=A0ABQ2XUN6_9BURK|nr:DUF1837 domain-containing protein [Undibacterium squillarum]GGX33875.1 hypothetical protein GCM10010946_08680 [Undibacterium squillarum]
MAEKEEELLQLKLGLEGLLDPVKLSQHVAVAAVSQPPSKPSTTLMHVRFVEDKADVAKLAAYLWSAAQNYSLSRRRREEIRAQIEAAPGGDLSAFTLVTNAVRDAFMEFNNEYPHRSSEVGELLAYCIALEQLGAAQLLAKMALKTNNNMPVHGLDGIHGKVENGWLVLYFLESKLSGSANAGAKEFAKSVAGFSNNSKQYQREYQLVKELGNLDALSPDDKKIALEYFDIFGSSDKHRRERYVGVILYSDPKSYNSLPEVKDEQEPGFHEKVFSEEYAKQLGAHQASALKHIENENGNAEKCRVYFVAVPDADDLRNLLYKAMGYVPLGKATNKSVVPVVKNASAMTKTVLTSKKNAVKKSPK